MAATTKTTTNDSVMSLLKKLVATSCDSKSLLNSKNRSTAVKVKEMLGLETPMQAILLSAFVDMFDDKHIAVRDISRHFGVRTIDILSIIDELKFFTDRGYIGVGHENYDSTFYYIGKNVISSLTNENRLPEPRKQIGLSVDEYVDNILELLDCAKSNSDNSNNISAIRKLTNANMQIPLAAKLKSLNLEDSSLVFFFALIKENIQDHFYSIGMGELRHYMRPAEARSIIKQLAEGDHPLAKAQLVEPFYNKGVADLDEWTFTKECCDTLLLDIPVVILDKSESRSSNVVSHGDIVAKELFYSDKVSRNVAQLEEIMNKESMKNVMNQLNKRGMRKCFTCIMYGGPGTGKTETVLQLARRTGRDIMMVDIPSIRDKWVGETEKNIKRIFDQYRALVKSNEIAPILCFNEADALICRRNNGERSVDKMENAMQDIILGEMETLEGIMIATTNLVDNMDKAFERRFLYKIEFDRPSADSRKRIWKSMLPELSDDLAERLADSYEFSGGEMENISRKYAITCILHCKDEVDENLLFELCQSERYATDYKSVGFKVG